MAERYQVEFTPAGATVEVEAGRSVLEASRAAGVELASVCGGEGTCGRCRVVVLDGEPGAPSGAERQALSGEQLASGQRLACRLQVRAPMRVGVPRASLMVEERLQTHGPGAETLIDSPIGSFDICVSMPSSGDVRDDLERVTAAVVEAGGPTSLGAGPAVLRDLGPRLRADRGQVRVYVRDDAIIGVVPPAGRTLGYAVDLGTTKIAGYLLDLEDGSCLAEAGTPNPQASFGEDVVSRLNHAARSAEHAHELTTVVRGALDGLLGRLCAMAGVTREEVADGCIVANTVMHHLLLGLSTRQLARAPFVPETCAALEVGARDLALSMAPDARIHVPPCIAGFVGADHVAMILGADLDRVDVVKVGVDIGTNTEVVLSHPDRARLTVTSCASGPAFEGAHIEHGMRAASGAIEGVRLDGQRGAQLRIIGGAPALGICGSGIVDAVAELRRTGLMDARGRLRSDGPGVRRGPRGPEIVLVPAAESGIGRDICIAQADVDEIQLAKGAIAAGISIVLEAAGTAASEVDELVLAGAFGSYLNLDSALDIGLLPRLPRASYVQIGNAAGAGARAALLSLAQRERARTIAREADYLELTTWPGFGRRFARAMSFASTADGEA